MNGTYQMCSRCIFDSTLPRIEFSSKGECNYCQLYDDLEKEYPLGEEGQQNLDRLIADIKNKGKNQEYDCVVGVSGGTDSTYTLYKVKKLGLNPLAVHFDNGWDTEIAVSNIKKAIEKLDIDLHTYVVDWEEFKDVQIAFLKASVPDTEIPTDYGIHAVLYKIAAENRIGYILNGLSFRTEGNMPVGWVYADGRYIKSVHKQFGQRKLKTYPQLTLLYLIYYIIIKKIKVVRFLNYIDYSKLGARQVLERELGWKDSGGHHYESVYTRFYQAYISPIKFGMERRLVSFAAQIRAGQLSREEALTKIEEVAYPEEKIEEDKEYIAKKLNLEKEALEKILAFPPKTFLDYPSYYPLFKKLRFLLALAAKWKLLPIIYHPKKYSM